MYQCGVPCHQVRLPVSSDISEPGLPVLLGHIFPHSKGGADLWLATYRHRLSRLLRLLLVRNHCDNQSNHTTHKVVPKHYDNHKNYTDSYVQPHTYSTNDSSELLPNQNATQKYGTQHNNLNNEITHGVASPQT
jgi:hypothetical protein